MDPLRHVKPAVRRSRAYTLAGAARDRSRSTRTRTPTTCPRRSSAACSSRRWRGRGRATRTSTRRELLAGARRLRRLARGRRPRGQRLQRADRGAAAGDGRRPARAVVIPEPTFTLYALLTTVLGGEVERVPLSLRRRTARASPTTSTRSCAAAPREPGAAVTIVCSPNNPTGSMPRRAPTSSGCARDGDGLVVIDEAYHEFAGTSVVPLLERHPNLVVLRTFSKAMAMAGLRVGLPAGLARARARDQQGAAALQPELLLAAGRARGARGAGRAARKACDKLVARARAAPDSSWPTCPGVRALPVARELLPVRAPDGRAPRRCSRRSRGAACSCAT